MENNNNQDDSSSLLGCLIVYVVGALLVTWFACDIEPTETYSWYSGIWHGINFTDNWIFSLFTDRLFKARSFGTGYEITFIITSVINVIAILIFLFFILVGLFTSGKDKKS